jgi:hypothetical protein
MTDYERDLTILLKLADNTWWTHGDLTEALHGVSLLSDREDFLRLRCWQVVWPVRNSPTSLLARGLVEQTRKHGAKRGPWKYRITAEGYRALAEAKERGVLDDQPQVLPAPGSSTGN